MNLALRTFGVTCIFFVIQLANFALGQPVKLAWDSASASGEVGYNVYRSNRAGVYTKPPLNGSKLLRTPAFTDSTAQTGQTYYYAITSVSPSGLESGYSNEVELVVKPSPIVNPPAAVVIPPAAHNTSSSIRTRAHQSSGMAIIRSEQNRVLVSQAAIRAAPLMRTGRTYVEFQQSVNTGVALVNPNAYSVVVDFYFADENGMKLYSGSLTLGSNANTIGFLNEAPFAPQAKSDLPKARTFTFSASAPIAFTAVRGFTNERSEFIMTPLPVPMWEATATAPSVIPYYTHGGPWKARIIMINPANTALSGVLEVFTSRGADSVQRVNYIIPSSSAISVLLGGPEADMRGGWIRINPNEGTGRPSALALLSFRSNDGSDYEFGVAAVPEESAFRIYTETSGVGQEAGPIQSSVVLTNSSSTPAMIHLEALQMDGTQTGLHRILQVPPSSQTSISDEITDLLKNTGPFQGFLRFSGAPIAAAGLNAAYNERGHLLVTAMPAIPESALASGAE